LGFELREEAEKGEREVAKIENRKSKIRISGRATQLDLVHTLVYISLMKQVNIHDAKTRLSELLARVEAGEEITIAKAGRPVARLVPVREKAGERTPGTAKGKVMIGRDFEEPLPEQLLSEFEG
jgi:prevent-host-death family protein